MQKWWLARHCILNMQWEALLIKINTLVMFSFWFYDLDCTCSACDYQGQLVCVWGLYELMFANGKQTQLHEKWGMHLKGKAAKRNYQSKCLHQPFKEHLLAIISVCCLSPGSLVPLNGIFFWSELAEHISFLFFRERIFLNLPELEDPYIVTLSNILCQKQP